MGDGRSLENKMPEHCRNGIHCQTHACICRCSACSEVCTFRYDHDPATLAPRGRACKRSAVEEIHWKDGRTSVACREHGVEALTENAKAEVLRVVRL